jgi:hypothetical protein
MSAAMLAPRPETRMAARLREVMPELCSLWESGA